MNKPKTKHQVSPDVTARIEGNSSISATINPSTFNQEPPKRRQSINCSRYTNSESKNAVIEAFLDSKKVTITMSFVTIFALFADDVKTLGFVKSEDNTFSSLIVICLLLFLLELLLSFFYKPNYKWSFYFWLDLIATLSLLTDIGWIWDSLIGVSNSSSSSKQLQNAGKASRAGTRTSRVLRIIRLIRLIRIVKLYKNAQIAKEQVEEDDEEIIVEENNFNPESKVGKKLSEVTMKRLILIVLVLLFLLPFFESSYYYSVITSWDFGSANLNEFIGFEAFEEVKNTYIDYHKDDIRPMVYLTWTNRTGTFEWKEGIDYNDLRYNEIYFSSAGDITAIFDTRYDSKMSSLLNIMKTIFICIVLTLGALYFSKDAEDLVINPLDKIIEKVKKIAKNPISASEIRSSSHQLPQSKKFLCFKSTSKPHQGYEVLVIENTIIKIGILLALGFGEAGSSIIGQNVEKSGEVDPMTSGTKIVGIFGFCDIRNFTDTTEELQEGVMMFVNEIAQIVHGVVDKYFGAANKNIGDAFLLVWKFTNEEYYLDDDVIVKGLNSKRAGYLPDLALMSFLKILAKVNKDPSMLRYRSNQKLLQRMPNYEVKMGFGLHLGWAIEGAIGSQFKVDASYLSPHVNIASALEGSTKIYGVPLLLSGTFYQSLSLPIQSYCRHIDTILLKGNLKEIPIYTSDCDFSNFTPGKGILRNKEMFRKKRKNLKRKIEKDGCQTDVIFYESREIALMRKGFSKEFYSVFSKAVTLYVDGDWKHAKSTLEAALDLRQKDGPSLSLLNYMAESGFKVPEDWPHARFLG